jgi:hypothetical protein
MHPAYKIVAIVLLAFGVGFATRRGSICGLLAARQFAETGRTSRLAAFVTASLWALVLAVPLCWLTGNAAVLSPSFEVSAAAVLGGALYGLGTFINGGCGLELWRALLQVIYPFSQRSQVWRSALALAPCGLCLALALFPWTRR